MEDRKASNEASFEKLKTVLDEQKAKYEVISKNNEAFTYHYSYLIYSLPVARKFDEIRDYDNDPSIDTILKSNFLKYRGISNYEAIYSSELKCIECEVQSGRVPTATYITDRISRFLSQESV